MTLARHAALGRGPNTLLSLDLAAYWPAARISPMLGAITCLHRARHAGPSRANASARLTAGGITHATLAKARQ